MRKEKIKNWTMIIAFIITILMCSYVICTTEYTFWKIINIIFIVVNSFNIHCCIEFFLKDKEKKTEDN